MKKRLVSSLLCLCLILTFLPTAALAADYGNPELPQLGLGTREEVVANTYYLLDEAGSLTEGTEDHYNLYFDDAAKTLFLKDAVLKSSLYVPGGTTVDLDGENTIEQAGTGIQVQGDGLSGNHEQHRGHSGAEQLLRRHRDQGQHPHYIACRGVWHQSQRHRICQN